jgi:SpoVK/Ycf46/Vps4 family AAA+-type ATPase
MHEFGFLCTLWYIYTMENFTIVLALCRAALQSQNPAVENHIRRLAKALEQDGSAEQAKSLVKLAKATEKLTEIQPSRVVTSFAATLGETLTPGVKAPVDRETGAPLADIIFPGRACETLPVFHPELERSVRNLLEEWTYVDRLVSAGVRPALSLMLFGHPGTGKTLLAHHIARSLGYPLIVAKLDGLVSSFLGTTARNISNLFAFASRYQCILLLDEFDAIGKLRDDPNELGELKRVVNTLLQCLDARSLAGFTVAITNHQNLLDPAVWRRFDIRIEIPKPDWNARLLIVRKNFSGVTGFSDNQLRFLAWLLNDSSGSDIEKLADFMKRRLAIHAGKEPFLDSVRAYITLSASLSQNDNRSAVLGSQELLAERLFSDADVAMSQEDLAEFFGKTQSTISRWFKKDKTSFGVKNA